MPWLSGPRHCAQFELEAEGFVLAGPEKPKTTMQQVSNEQSNIIRIRFT
jgi:hypothetical protein